MHTFRFIHAADIHLDSPLKGLAGHEGSVVERIRRATREALAELVSIAIREEVAFMIIAGDVYDGSWRDYQTGRYFVRQMGRLRAKGIPVYMIYGNHDAESQITRRLTLPENVTVFSAKKPETYGVPTVSVVLHGQSFYQRDVTENLARTYPLPVSGKLNIGILHTALTGAEGHDNYAPCSMGDLTEKGYDYWALGHVHERAVLHKHPYVVYSGVLQGRHIRETGPKGASLVTVEDREIVDVSHFSVDVVRWEVLKIDASNAEVLLDLEEQVRSAIERAAGEHADGRILACRIIVEGATAVHENALADIDRLTTEARAAAESLGRSQVWIEKLKISTRPLQKRKNEGAMTEAFGKVSEARTDPGLQDELREALGTLINRLPHEVRKDPDDPLLQAAIDEDFQQLIDLAEPLAWAYLRGKRSQ